jgi:acetyl esterase
MSHSTGSSAWFPTTPDQRAQLAAQLRGASMVATRIQPAHAAALTRTSREVRLVPTRVGHTRVIHHRPCTHTALGDALYINIHGGGFVRGHAERDTTVCAWLTETVGCQVLDIDYRLAPEHPFPTALHECWDVVRWAVAQASTLGLNPARLAVGGNSAGGNLAAGIAILGRREGGPMPCLQILDYPFLDAVTDPADKVDAGGGPLPADRMRAFNALYLARPEDAWDPLVSTLRASTEDLRGQPPALVLLAGRDALRDEGLRHIENLLRAGVDVHARVFADSEHGFVVHGQGEASVALEMIAHALRQAFLNATRGAAATLDGTSTDPRPTPTNPGDHE